MVQAVVVLVAKILDLPAIREQEVAVVLQLLQDLEHMVLMVVLVTVETVPVVVALEVLVKV